MKDPVIEMKDFMVRHRKNYDSLYSKGQEKNIRLLYPIIVTENLPFAHDIDRSCTIFIFWRRMCYTDSSH